MPLLPLSDELLRTTPFDAECAALADRHYSRQTPGSNQFMGNGKKIVLRDNDGSVVFGWLWSEFRNDGERGYNCAIFRNESDRVASETILECEGWAVKEWGPNRAFTFIDPAKVKPTMVRGYPVFGWCFYRAGWHFVKVTNSGKHLLEKELR
jgi:hypothetical protein